MIEINYFENVSRGHRTSQVSIEKKLYQDYKRHSIAQRSNPTF